MTKILCIGNRYVYPDGAALWIYEKVIQNKLQTLEWIEGGLGGLNLITHFEGCSKVLLLDYVQGVKNAQLFSFKEILEHINVQSYSHESAFYYLLNSLDDYFDGEAPKIELISCNPEDENYMDEVLELVYKRGIDEK
jgi:hydrogenase maturation protease